MIYADVDLDHLAVVCVSGFSTVNATHFGPAFLTIGLEACSPVGFLSNKAENLTSTDLSVMCYFSIDSIPEKGKK